MRVIRTEMYFEDRDVRGFDRRRISRRDRDFDEDNPGVAFAWFRMDTVHDPLEVENLKAFRPIRPEQPIRPQRDDLRGILDLFVRDADEIAFLRIPGPVSIENAQIIDYILDQEIIMERSPPFSLSLKGLLTKANPNIWIGTLTGGYAAWDHPVLLLLTVPGGIIAVSSASGIGRAMGAGLNKVMKRLFDRAS